MEAQVHKDDLVVTPLNKLGKAFWISEDKKVLDI